MIVLVWLAAAVVLAALASVCTDLGILPNAPRCWRCGALGPCDVCGRCADHCRCTPGTRERGDK